MNKCFKIPFCKYKHIDFFCGINRNIESIFIFEIHWTKKCSHAGFQFLFFILSMQLEIDIIDDRHWHHEENRWMTNDEWNEICLKNIELFDALLK